MEYNLLKYRVEPPYWRQAFPISPRSGLAYVEQRKLGRGSLERKSWVEGCHGPSGLDGYPALHPERSVLCPV